MGLEAKRPANDFQIALILTNEQGETIIHTQSDAGENFRMPTQKRMFRINYKIPRNSLRQGMYYVSIFGVIPNIARVFAHQDVVGFMVEASSAAVTRHANSAWRGSLSPCFGEWGEDNYFQS